MEEQNFSQKLNGLYAQVKEYVQLRLDFFTLTIGEYAVFLMSRLIITIVLFWVAFFATLFLAGALVAWIGMSSGNWPIAMLAGAGVFILIGLVVFIFRKPFIFTPLNHLYVRLLDLRKQKESNG